MASITQRSNPLLDASAILSQMAPIFLGGGKTTQTNNNLDPAVAAALANSIKTGTYSKEAAAADSQEAMSNAMKTLLETNMPTIGAADRGSGAYNNTTTKLLANDLAARTAGQGAQIKLDTAAKYGDITNQTAQTLKGANPVQTVEVAPVVAPKSAMNTALLAGGGLVASSLLNNMIKGMFSGGGSREYNYLEDPENANKKGFNSNFDIGSSFSGGADILNMLTPDFMSGSPNNVQNFDSDFGATVLDSLSSPISAIDFFSGSEAPSSAPVSSSLFDLASLGFGDSVGGGVDISTPTATFDLGGIFSSIADFFSSGSSSDTGGSSWCFITTAVCENSGKPDDCEELTLLRNFRDTFMQQTELRRAKVAQYYNEAPALVSAIEALPEEDRANVYTALESTFIVPAIEAIKEGDLHKAEAIYTLMFNYVKKFALSLILTGE